MGSTNFGRYRLDELIGSGGMGEVWQAYDTGTDRVVAIKVLRVQYAADPTYGQRFRREARAAARLESPHVVPIYDFGEIEGQLYVAMRLIKGHDLASVIAHGPLTPERAVGVVDQIAKALSAAHKIGLVHRDVKPSNILLDEDEHAYLIDFGIARIATETGLTSTDTTVGTWAYMAPERFTTDDVDPRSDVYALACVLHECLTGQRPYPGDGMQRQVVGHLYTPPPQPSVVRPGTPAAFDPVIAVGMAKDATERYGAATDLALAAREAITDTSGGARASGESPAPASPVPYLGTTMDAAKTLVPEAPSETPRRRRGGRIALAVGVIAVVGVVAAVVLVRSDDTPPTSLTTTTTTSPLMSLPPTSDAVPVVFIGAECALAGSMGISEDGSPAYCAPLQYTDQYLWSATPDEVPNVALTTSPSTPAPVDTESQIQLCVTQTDHSRLQCAESILRSSPG